jgi:hypothetical protein
MTLLTLALIRHDLEARKRERPAEDDEEEKPQRQDVHDMVAEVTSAIAPFLLPLVGCRVKLMAGYGAQSQTDAGIRTSVARRRAVKRSFCSTGKGTRGLCSLASDRR